MWQLLCVLLMAAAAVAVAVATFLPAHAAEARIFHLSPLSEHRSAIHSRGPAVSCASSTNMSIV
jgi:hypothetical protein